MADTSPPAPKAADVIIGKRYRVIRLLGEGGMGSVFEAENTSIKKRVALKVMSASAANSEQFVRRFMQEAETAAQLSHPNIVDVLDMGQDEASGQMFIVQELLVGHDLGKHLEAVGRLSPRESLELLMPVMEALVMAHGRGVVHRDLKPDNIFLAETVRGVVPKLIDFGIAKVRADGESRSMTSTGTLMGTPYYISPEGGRGDTTLDARADVWSLGVVLYEMLSGTRPFTAVTAHAVIAKIIYEAPQPLTEAAPDLPPELVAVVMRALQKDRDDRYPTMQAFLDAVRAYASDGVAPSQSATSSLPPTRSSLSAATVAGTFEDARTMPITGAVSPSGSSSKLQTLAPIETIPPRPMRKRSGLIAAVVLGVLGVTAAAAFSRRAAAPTPTPVHLTVASPTPLTTAVDPQVVATRPVAPSAPGLPEPPPARSDDAGVASTERALAQPSRAGRHRSSLRSHPDAPAGGLSPRSGAPSQIRELPPE